MQKLIVLLVIAGAYAAPGFRGGEEIDWFTCPAEVANGCTGPKQCLYPNPRDCNSYIQCNEISQAWVRPCAPANPPLVWNDAIKECDWASNTECVLPTTAAPTTAEPTDEPTEAPTTAAPTNAPTNAPTDAPTDAPTSAPSGFICPTEDIAATGCMGPKDCLYPNPADCNSFIQCTVNADNTTGTPVVMPCAPADPPLEWNDNTKECDWPANSTCPKNSSPASTTTTTTTTTQAPETTTAADTTTAASSATASSTTASPPTSAQTTPSGFVCPRDDIAGGCNGPKDCLYPNPANCNSFIQCVPQPDGSGNPVVMPCPDGLEWNDNIKQCDWPSSDTCTKASSAPAASTTTTTTPAATTTEEPTTTEESTDAPTTASSTTKAPETTTPNSCGDDDSADAGLDLPGLCAGCSAKRLVANPNSQQRYVECNGGADGQTNSVQKCSPGLLFNQNSLTCDYAGLVNSNGPSK